MCLGENLERKRERIYLEKCSKCPESFFFSWSVGVWGLYIENITFRLLAATKWPLVGANGPLVTPRSNADISNPGFFPGLILDAYLEAFLTFN